MPKDPLGSVSVSELGLGDFGSAIPKLVDQQRTARRSSTAGGGSSMQGVLALLKEQRAMAAQQAREQRAEESAQRARERARRTEIEHQWRLEDRQRKQQAAEAKEQAAQALTNPPTFEPPEGYEDLPFSEQNRLYQEWAAETLAQVQQANPTAKDSDLLAFRSRLLERSPPPAKPKRSGLDLAADVAGGLGSGVTQMVRSTLGIGLDTDNPVMQALDAAGKAIQPSSPVEIDRQKQIAFEMQQLQDAYDNGDVGPWRKFFEEAGIQLGNMSVGGIMELAGNILPSIGATLPVGLAARGLALRSGALASRVAAGGADAAKALETAAKIGQRTAGRQALRSRERRQAVRPVKTLTSACLSYRSSSSKGRLSGSAWRTCLSPMTTSASGKDWLKQRVQTHVGWLVAWERCWAASVVSRQWVVGLLAESLRGVQMQPAYRWRRVRPLRPLLCGGRLEPPSMPTSRA